MEPRTSVPLAGFIIIEDQQELIFLFSDYWAALSREGSQASRKNICLSKAKPVSITALSSTFWTPTRFYQRFTLSQPVYHIAYSVCSEIASFRHAVLPVHKGMKGLRGRKTSAILFIHERNSRPHRPHKLRCTTGALLAKKRGEHGISRVYASLGS